MLDAGSIQSGCGVRPLAAQKPIKRPGWWKGDFALCWMLAAWRRGGWTPVQRPTPPPTDNQWATAFIDRGRGRHADIARSVLAVILKLVIGTLTSGILIVLGPVSLSSRVGLFPFL